MSETALREARTVLKRADECVNGRPDFLGIELVEELANALRSALAGVPAPPEDLSAQRIAEDMVQSGFLAAGFAVESKRLTEAGLSTVFDIATDTGVQRLGEVLERMKWTKRRGSSPPVGMTEERLADLLAEAPTLWVAGDGPVDERKGFEHAAAWLLPRLSGAPEPPA